MLVLYHTKTDIYWNKEGLQYVEGFYFTLLFWFARFIRSLPIPCRTIFKDVKRLSNTAGFEEHILVKMCRHWENTIFDTEKINFRLLYTLKLMSSGLEKPWLCIIFICLTIVLFPLSATPATHIKYYFFLITTQISKPIKRDTRELPFIPEEQTN